MEFFKYRHLKGRLLNQINFSAMTPKKTKRTNLENKRIIFFEYGAVLTLVILLAAFEWGKSLPEVEYPTGNNEGTVIEIMTDITRVEKSIPKPPVMPTEIIIVKDPTIIIDEPQIADVEKFNPWEAINLTIKKKIENPIEDTFRIVEDMPKYRKGTVANFQKHVQELVKYPQEAMDNSIEGTVYLQFIVNEKGVLINPEIVRSPNDVLSNAVLQAIKKTEKWTPGKQRKIPVKVAFTIPVKFTLKEK
jgi:periplasmic protein TonB